MITSKNKYIVIYVVIVIYNYSYHDIRFWSYIYILKHPGMQYLQATPNQIHTGMHYIQVTDALEGCLILLLECPE